MNSTTPQVKPRIYLQGRRWPLRPLWRMDWYEDGQLRYTYFLKWQQAVNALIRWKL